MRVHLPLATLALCVLLLAECGSEDAPADEGADAGSEVDAPPYVGTAVGGPIPLRPGDDEGTSGAPDGGGFVTDDTCCDISFAISDMELVWATGALVGTYDPLVDSGVPLSRQNGMWTATVCMPLHVSLFYWYELTELGEASVEVTRRINPNEPNQPSGAGESFNTFGPLASCPGPSGPRFLVAPSGDGHETIAPSEVQVVQSGAGQTFTVLAHNGYSLATTVSGTCAPGSWNGSLYTTGLVTGDCTVVFSSSSR